MTLFMETILLDLKKRLKKKKIFNSLRKIEKKKKERKRINYIY